MANCTQSPTFLLAKASIITYWQAKHGMEEEQYGMEEEQYLLADLLPRSLLQHLEHWLESQKLPYLILPADC